MSAFAAAIGSEADNALLRCMRLLMTQSGHKPTDCAWRAGILICLNADAGILINKGEGSSSTSVV
jgi:hypothetical protein